MKSIMGKTVKTQQNKYCSFYDTLVEQCVRVCWRRQQIARKEPLNHKSYGDNAQLSVVMATLRRFCG